MSTFARSSPRPGHLKKESVPSSAAPAYSPRRMPGHSLPGGREAQINTASVHVCSRSSQQPPAREPNTQSRAAVIVLTRALWIRAGPELGDCKWAELLWSAAVRSIVCRGAGSWSQSGYEEGTARKLHTHSGSREEGGSTWQRREHAVSCNTSAGEWNGGRSEGPLRLCFDENM